MDQPKSKSNIPELYLSPGRPRPAFQKSSQLPQGKITANLAGKSALSRGWLKPSPPSSPRNSIGVSKRKAALDSPKKAFIPEVKKLKTMTNETTTNQAEEEKEDVKSMFQQIMDSNKKVADGYDILVKSNQGVTESLGMFKDEIKKEVQENATEFTRQVTELRSKTDTRFAALESKMSSLSEKSAEASTESDKVDATWQVICQEAVREAERSIMVYGAKIVQSKQGVVDFLTDSVEMDPDFITKEKVKDIQMLGRQDAENPPPVLIRFAHNSIRNTILGNAGRVKVGFQLDKAVPKPYIETGLSNDNWV